MRNLQAVLNGAGSSLARVAFARVYLVNFADYAAMNAVYASYFAPGRSARPDVHRRDRARARRAGRDRPRRPLVARSRPVRGADPRSAAPTPPSSSSRRSTPSRAWRSRGRARDPAPLLPAQGRDAAERRRDRHLPRTRRLRLEREAPLRARVGPLPARGLPAAVLPAGDDRNGRPGVARAGTAPVVSVDPDALDPRCDRPGPRVHGRPLRRGDGRGGQGRAASRPDSSRSSGRRSTARASWRGSAAATSRPMSAYSRAFLLVAPFPVLSFAASAWAVREAPTRFDRATVRETRAALAEAPARGRSGAPPSSSSCGTSARRSACPSSTTWWTSWGSPRSSSGC